jgi:uncharacterized oxidoreductase
MKTAGNTILITGGGSGIGLALAKRLVKNNTVIICGRDGSKLKKASQELNNCPYIICDITNKQQVEGLVKTCNENFPELNCIINNAGVSANYGLQSTASFSDNAAMEINTNYLAVVHLNELFLPSLLMRPQAAIIHISSVVALVPSAWWPTYSASKAALHAYIQTLQFRLKNTGVKVFEVLPPLVDTNFSGEIKGKKKISPDAVANSVIHAISKNQFKVHIGITKVVKILNRLSPAAARVAVNKSTQS